MKPITINGITIDPGAPTAALASLSLNNATAKNSDYIIVQTKQPLDRSQRAALAKGGKDHGVRARRCTSVTSPTWWCAPCRLSTLGSLPKGPSRCR
jgi:hypothetical protein